MARLTARLSGEARALLFNIARDDHERRLGRAQIAVIQAGLDAAAPHFEKYPFAPGGEQVNSVQADTALTKRVDAAGKIFNLLKRTEIVQELMEIGLTVMRPDYIGDEE